MFSLLRSFSQPGYVVKVHGLCLEVLYGGGILNVLSEMQDTVAYCNFGILAVFLEYEQECK